MISRAKSIGFASAICFAAIVGYGWANVPEDVVILDVDMKTHLVDALDQSTYELDGFLLSPNENYTQILLTSFMNERDGHTLIRLRDGDETATIPYFPIYGDLYVSRSIIQELDLRYYNFAEVTPDKRPDMPDMSNAVATTPQEDIGPILEIIDLLYSFGWAEFKGHCYKNRFPDENTTVVCPEKLVYDPQGDMTRRTIIDTYIRLAEDAYNTDDIQKLDAIGRPILGAWIKPDGTLVRAELTARTDYSASADVPWSERKFNLELHLNFHSQYAAIRANRLGDCYPVFERPQRQYTPTQSQIVFDGLYEALGPPEFDGGLVTDPVRQERIAWGLERIADEPFSNVGYHSTRAWDRHFSRPREPGGAMNGKLSTCDLVDDLEAAAGYVRR